MKIAFTHGDKEGFVRYNKGDREVMVTHPDKEVRERVRNYLTSENAFDMELGENPNGLGNRVRVLVKPSDDIEHMQMALNELSVRTGARVNWGHEDNNFSGSTIKKLNNDPDKSIVKSLDGDEYELL